MSTTQVVVGVVLWLAVSIVVGASGLPTHLRQPMPQVLIFTLTLAVLVSVVTIARFRTWVMTVDVRAHVLIHLSRLLAGGYFLVLYQRGELPWVFAVPGGIGDMIVAVLAVIVLAAPRRSLLFAWNVIGFVDILMVVAAAVRSARADPPSMAALLQLPLVVLPTFLVPIIIATHVIIFVRLARRSP